MTASKIYVSYAWKDRDQNVDESREHLVNELCKAFEKKGFHVTRDKTDMHFRDLIRNFMNNIADAAAIIVVISEKYLKSPYCMYELTAAWDKGDFHRRIFPIVLTDGESIYDELKQIKWVNYWKNQYKEYEEAVAELDDAAKEGFLQKLRDREFIYQRASGAITCIAGMVGIPASNLMDSRFEEIISQVINQAELTIPVQSAGMPAEIQSTSQLNHDWGNAPDVPVFFGRIQELAVLEQWIINDRCRLVTILGMGGIGKTGLSIKLGQGGIGKTDLSLKLAQGIQTEFEYVIWRKLINAPPVTEILGKMIKFLSNQQDIDLPDTIENQILRLLHYLKAHRCLLILDNVEAVLCGGDKAGQYIEGFEGYGELFRQVGEVSHQSCLLLTSREKPQEIALLEGEKKPVRSLELGGLDATEGQNIFAEIGEFSGSKDDWKELNEFYNGNPLVLELAARHIKKVFFGNISIFLKEGRQVFGKLRDLLDWHFERLSTNEKEIMYWLAINREPVMLSELKDDILSLHAKEQVPETLDSLFDQIPIERNREYLTLQPVLIEYMTVRLIEHVDGEIRIVKPEIVNYTTERLVERIGEEIETGEIALLNNHSLIKALSKDYVIEAQRRLIIKPILDRLLVTFGEKSQIETQLKKNLSILQKKYYRKPGYAAGNVLNMLCQLETDLKSYDFSHLTIWQAYLQGMNLPEINFAHCIFAKTLFTQTFGAILSVAFSPDGKILATSDAHGEIRLWQITDGKLILKLQAHTDWVRSVVISPNGRILASGSHDRTLKLWDIQSGRCLNTLTHTDWVKSIAFSPDNQIIADGCADFTVKLWKVSTGQLINTLEGHTKRVSAVAFSPDGKTIVSGSEDHTIRLWDVATGQCLNTLRDHTDVIRSVVFNHNGQTFASGSYDKTIKLWNVSTGQCLNTLQGHTNLVWSIAFSPDSRIIVSGSYDKTIKLWNVSTGQCLNTLQGHNGRITSVAFNPDGKTFASGSLDETVKLWDVATGRCLNSLQGYRSGIWSIAFNPDGQTLVSSGDDQIIKTWNVSTNQYQNSLHGHDSRIRSIAFSHDGRTLVSGGDDQIIKIWDVSRNQCISTLKIPSGWIWSMAFNNDGKTIAFSTDKTVVYLWDILTSQYVNKLDGHTDWVLSLAFYSDGQMLASGSYDHTVRIWRIDNGQCLNVLHEHKDKVWSVIFSPDAQFMASGSADQTIRIWEVSNWKCLKTLQGHTLAIRALAFSPESRKLASASEDMTVKLWDVSSGKCIKTMQGHTGIVRSVAFSPDGKIIASASLDETIKFWSAKTGELLRTLRAPRPYEGMNITGAKGLTEAQKNSLKTLGAVEYDI
jgi:WD40 repeat protein